MNYKKKILFVLPTLHAGGAENYALRFINYCKEEYIFDVISLNNQKGDLHDAFKATGATLHYKSIGYLNFFKIYQIFRFLKNNKFDTIATFNGNFGGIFIWVARIAGIDNRIALYRRSKNAYKSNFFKSIYNKFIIFLIRKHAIKILSNSEFALNNFHPNHYLTDNRFKVIANGVDAQLYNANLSMQSARAKLGIDQDSFIIGNVGRFDPAKNHKTIFLVAMEILKHNENVLFLFCGKGTDSEAFRNELISHGIQNQSISLGLQNNLHIIYRALDIFYFPSLTEGQPNALIEAMLSGIPIVASNIEPIKEAIPFDLHNFLLDPVDVNENCNFIQQVINDKILRKKLIQIDWATRKFNKNINFDLFKNEI